MNPIALHAVTVQRDTLHQKADIGNAEIGCELIVNRRELTRVGRTIVRRNLYTGQKRLGTARDDLLDDAGEVLSQQANRLTAQTVVSADLDDHEVHIAAEGAAKVNIEFYQWTDLEVVDTFLEIEADFDAIRRGFISITPIHVDLTRYQALDQVAGWVGEIAMGGEGETA